jgi:hypothetical protein
MIDKNDVISSGCKDLYTNFLYNDNEFKFNITKDTILNHVNYITNKLFLNVKKNNIIYTVLYIKKKEKEC